MRGNREVEDGMGFAGLVPSASERREDELSKELDRCGRIIADLKADRERMLTRPAVAWRTRIVDVLQKYNVRLDGAPLDALTEAMQRLGSPREHIHKP